MTANTTLVEFTQDQLAALDEVLQGHEGSPILEAAHQAIRNAIEPKTEDPLERVQIAVDAVIEADQRVTQQIEHRRQVILAALDAGYTQQAVADHLGRSQPRIAQMLKAN